MNDAYIDVTLEREKAMKTLRSLAKRISLTALLAVLVLSLTGCPSTDNLYGQAYSHYTRRDEARALELLSLIIERDERYVPAYVLQSTIYETRGDWAAAEQALRAAEEKAPPSPVVSFNLGNIHFKKGEYGKAVEKYTRSIQINTSFNEAYINRANAHMKLKEYPDALRDYEKFLSLPGKEYTNVRELVKVLRRDLGLGPVDLRK